MILNLDNRANSISHYGSDDDLGFLERMRSAWQGNDQGLHRTPNDNNWRTSRIPAIQEKLQELNEKFLQYQQQKINSGFERPESMPVEMHDRQMELQARLSLAQTELDYILEHIEKITSVVKEKDDSMV